MKWSKPGAETVVKLDGGGIARSAVPTLAADMGMKVNIGVRPEDLVATDADPIFTGEVEITEALGEVTLLYFKRQGEALPVVGKLPGIHTGLRRKAVHLTADPKKVHLFHNGLSLLYRRVRTGPERPRNTALIAEYKARHPKGIAGAWYFLHVVWSLFPRIA